MVVKYNAPVIRERAATEMNMENYCGDGAIEKYADELQQQQQPGVVKPVHVVKSHTKI